MSWRVAAAAAGLAACARPAIDTDTDTSSGGRPTVVRVATWNIATLGPIGEAPYEAVRAILARIDADLVMFNELTDADRAPFAALAQDIGYDTAFLPADNPFGDVRNALMTRLPVVSLGAPSAAALAREDRANDQTRLPIVVTVEIADAGAELSVVGQHFKSGFSETDQFRRAVDATRTAQAAALPTPLVVMGDLNADLDDMPESASPFTRPPAGLSASYRLGADLQSLLREGLPNDAFAPLLATDLTPVYATQTDGRTETRPESGRRIDWILVSDDLVDDLRAEVYDSMDEGQGGLTKRGPIPARPSSQQASDHLPVFADLTVQPEE